ncbi:MAG: TOBE domain-containing protein [Pseudorhodoferax sp.]
MQHTLGLTTVFVTHDQEEAMTTADRMAVLDGGVLQQVGSAVGLFDHPANRFVAGFVGTANLVDGRITAAGEILRFEAPGLGELLLPALPDGPAQPGPAAMAFRPHQVRIQSAGLPADAAHWWIDGEVESAEFLGEFSRYRVRVGSLRLLADQPHQGGDALFAPGAAVRLGIAPAQVRLLAG